MKKECNNCKKLNYLETCDDYKREFCLHAINLNTNKLEKDCLKLYHGSENLFCQACFNKKSEAEKEIMLGKNKR